MYHRLALNSWSPCLYFPSSRTTGVPIFDYIWLLIWLFWFEYYMLKCSTSGAGGMALHVRHLLPFEDPSSDFHTLIRRLSYLPVPPTQATFFWPMWAPNHTWYIDTRTHKWIINILKFSSSLFKMNKNCFWLFSLYICMYTHIISCGILF